MPRVPFVNFRAIKAAITMEQLLDHYGLMHRFKRSGDSLSGPCPIHKGENPTQFRVSISKNIWNCFSECKHGGNTLDFIARMENISIHAAALKAIGWFNLDQEAMSSSSEQDPEEQEHAPDETAASPAKARRAPAAPTAPTAEPEKLTPNPPLKFRLDKLNKEHPYLTERGLSPETIAEFGVGFCEKGTMAGRIAIPIENDEGAVVAYAGRLPGEATADAPKYKLPQGFRKSQELFNLHRAAREPKELPLVIVEGFFDCMKLYQAGHHKVVALMGSSMSSVQEGLIYKLTSAASRIIVMLDEDEAGRAGREDIAVRLASISFVKIHCFPDEGMQPEGITAEEVRQIAEGAV